MCLRDRARSTSTSQCIHTSWNDVRFYGTHVYTGLETAEKHSQGLCVPDCGRLGGLSDDIPDRQVGGTGNITFPPQQGGG